MTSSGEKFIARFQEFVENMLSIPSIENFPGILDYHTYINYAIKINSAGARKKHIMAFRNWVQENIQALKVLQPDLKFKSSIKYPQGNAEILMGEIFDKIEDPQMKSDFMQYIFGILEIIQPTLFDYRQKDDEIKKVFGEGTPATVEDEGATSSSNSGNVPDISDVFNSDSKEDKWIRDSIGRMQKLTRGKNPMAALKDVAMNPRMLSALMGIAGGKKQGIKIKPLIDKVAKMIPDDAEI